MELEDTIGCSGIPDTDKTVGRIRLTSHHVADVTSQVQDKPSKVTTVTDQVFKVREIFGAIPYVGLRQYVGLTSLSFVHTCTVIASPLLRAHT